jgi:hypothetical protein
MKIKDVAPHKEGTAEGYLRVDIQLDGQKIIFTQIGLTKRIFETLGLNTKIFHSQVNASRYKCSKKRP